MKTGWVVSTMVFVDVLIFGVYLNHQIMRVSLLIPVTLLPTLVNLNK